MKLQDGTNKAHEQRTDIEMIPTFVCRPKASLEDNNDLTMVISDENIHAEKSVQFSSDNNGKICASAGRVQLDSDHSSGKILFDNVVRNDIENQTKSGPITHASTEMNIALGNLKT